ncbi:CHS5 [Candida margitis]|uniref:CHS5 n=1 Tax=Candida margitis TaxID=1775924 RepID=UPI002226CB92|nr:CHS5 [Candida margitis]KAI5954080.1 CHS5 [Candida margitis]
MVEVSLTVGKLDASLALLLTKDHHLIEFPTILLPNGVRAGSIVKLKCDQDHESEKEEVLNFQNIQDEIYQTFATHPPKAPVLQIRNTTQTSCVLEWDTLDLGTSNLKNLILFKDGKKLGSIPQPMNNKTSKLSGLPVDKSFKFQLRLDTTAGIFWSNEVEVSTHKMTDLSGITVCLGDFSPNDPFTAEDIEKTLVNIGAKHPAQHQVKVDTTHFLCTRENKQNPEYTKANDMNIPIIRPEWIKACERERRIVGVRDFYVKECVLPDLFAKNYWGDSHGSRQSASHEGGNAQDHLADASTAASQDVPLDDTEAPGETEKSDLPPLPTKEEEVPKEKSEGMETTGAQQPAPTSNDNEPLEKQESDSTKLEVDDTEISTALPNSAQAVNETIDNLEQSNDPTQVEQDFLDKDEPNATASSVALKEDIDDAFDTVPISEENIIEVETKISDHPVLEGGTELPQQSADTPSTKEADAESEKSKLEEEKTTNEKEKEEKQAEKAIEEEKFEQKEEKEQQKEEMEHVKKEKNEVRGQQVDEKKEKEEGDLLENDEVNVDDDSTSKENSPAPNGNGSKKKKKKNKKNK